MCILTSNKTKHLPIAMCRSSSSWRFNKSSASEKLLKFCIIIQTAFLHILQVGSFSEDILVAWIVCKKIKGNELSVLLRENVYQLQAVRIIIRLLVNCTKDFVSSTTIFFQPNYSRGMRYMFNL